jgi:hypothetical protein
MAEKLKAQLWLHSRPKKGNFTKERKGEGKKKQTTLQQTSYNSYYNFNMSHAFSSSTSSFLLPSSQTKTHEGENDDHIISNPQLKNLTLTQTTLLHLGETKNKPNQNTKQNPNQTKTKPKPKPKSKSNQNQNTKPKTKSNLVLYKN